MCCHGRSLCAISSLVANFPLSAGISADMSKVKMRQPDRGFEYLSLMASFNDIADR
jgi:hypothetical protein